MTLASSRELNALRAFVSRCHNLVAITGAGLSTESGIPDYRGPRGAYSRGHQPTTFQQFVGDDLARKRYWFRAYLGWFRQTRAKPNRGHFALAKLEQTDVLKHLITQVM